MDKIKKHACASITIAMLKKLKKLIIGSGQFKSNEEYKDTTCTQFRDIDNPPPPWWVEIKSTRPNKRKPSKNIVNT